MKKLLPIIGLLLLAASAIAATYVVAVRTDQDKVGRVADRLEQDLWQDALLWMAFPDANTYDYGGGKHTNLNNGCVFNVTNNGYYEFSGSTNYIAYGNNQSFHFGTGDTFTVLCWVKARGTAEVICGKVANVGNAPGWFAYIQSGTRKPALYQITDASNRTIVEGVNALGNAIWSHVAITYSGNGLASGVGIYLNGTNSTLNVINDTTPTSTTNTADFMIGCRGTPASNGLNLDGDMGELIILNRVITGAEYTNHWNATKGTYGL